MGVREGGVVSGPEPDRTAAKILDAAMRVLADFGVKRSTIELVAKYAGVSHMTIYRRWPTKNDLLKSAVLREFGDLLDAAFVEAGRSAGSFTDRTLVAFTDVVWNVQNHPLAVRELNAESGEQLPLLSGASSAVMEACVPPVTAKLLGLAADAREPAAEIDPVADMFVRLAHSLVTVKRADQPLTTRGDLETYAGESFGPFLRALCDTGVRSVVDTGNAAVVDLDEHRRRRGGAPRMYLQIAVASVIALIALSAGIAAVVGRNINLPFIAPADVSRSTTPGAPAPPHPAPPNPPQSGELFGPAQDGLGPAFEPPQVEQQRTVPRAPSPAGPQAPVTGGGVAPAPAPVYTGGGADAPIPAQPKPLPPPPVRPSGQQPPPPQPPNPGGSGPAPGSPPPPPPPRPAPKQPGPGQPGPGQPGPGQPGPNQQQSRPN